ncbi:synaptic plasticity regulator PANTS isoform X2 [Emydura macquarii macquarii]|uniref:synaptic plasticity regulator PANTS isoform X2 n=1 Tax=Emydura macquarii macquarii TaxID=1129001 RepID=UPI00352BAC0F
MANSDVWRPPRTCEDYWSEWKHCKGIRNFFHNYYTYGEVPSCEQWKIDYSNCRQWEKSKSLDSKGRQGQLQDSSGVEGVLGEKLQASLVLNLRLLQT